MTAKFDDPITHGRPDLYGPIHKALRMAHTQMLVRLGQADFSIAQEALIADLRDHLAIGAAHLAHEEGHVHPALEARQPGVCAELESEHDSHRSRFVELEAAIALVESSALADRVRAGRSLYLQFSVFVGEDMLHMAQEETVIWPRLCALFTDAELMAIHGAILGSIPPQEHIATMRMMLPAVTRAERAMILGGMKANAPPQAFAAVIELAARPTLPPQDFAALEALGLAA